MKVLITGATGSVGMVLIDLLLANNFEVNFLTTSKHKINSLHNCTGYFWNLNKSEIDTNCFKNVKAIINLAGAPINKRWTKSYKDEILNSRIKSLKILREALNTIEHEVDHLISASAIGIYSSSYTNFYTEEEQGLDSSFLGKVVQEWENAADRFKAINISVSKIRIGLVLSEKAGVLPSIITPSKLGLGAAFGNGLQWQSWIHINDLAAMFVYLIKNKLYGIFNGVAPNPVTNKELVKAVTKELNKPLWLPNIPRFVLKIALGKMHEIIFLSHRVSSKKIENYGFSFKYHHLQNALSSLIK